MNDLIIHGNMREKLLNFSIDLAENMVRTLDSNWQNMLRRKIGTFREKKIRTALNTIKCLKPIK